MKIIDPRAPRIPEAFGLTEHEWWEFFNLCLNDLSHLAVNTESTVGFAEGIVNWLHASDSYAEEVAKIIVLLNITDLAVRFRRDFMYFLR